MTAVFMDAFCGHVAGFFFVAPVDLLTTHRVQQPGGAPSPARHRQQKTPACRGFLIQPTARLRSLDVCRLLALGAGDDIKTDALVFLQRLEAA